MKIAVVGLGVIGGSIAKALSRSGNHEIVGYDRDEQVLLEAISLGAISRKGSRADLEDAHVVYVCLYPESTVDFIEDNCKFFGENTVVTDVCGIKSEVYNSAKKISENNRFTYIGTHPMAGKEKNTFYASDSGLFFGASYIIIKDDSPQWAKGRLDELSKEMGFERIITTTYDLHDKIIAFTSQVPHVLACAYVMSPQCEFHDGFSAGSYRDVSRVANINAELWAGLFLANKKQLVDELDILLDNIVAIKTAVGDGDKVELVSLLQKAKEIKEKDFR